MGKKHLGTEGNLKPDLELLNDRPLWTLLSSNTRTQECSFQLSTKFCGHVSFSTATSAEHRSIWIENSLTPVPATKLGKLL